MSKQAPEQALEHALQQLLQPLAQLAVARGLPYAAAEELLKQAFVDAAAAANPDVPAHRNVSRISTATGINRREVTRLSQGRVGEQAAPARQARSVASEVFSHWRSHPAYSQAGQPKPLPRQGAQPSFESLAGSITRDVHPRSLLDELMRLGLAQHDEASDTVLLTANTFVPQGDEARMLSLLGANVGDHLSAAVANVTAPAAQRLGSAPAPIADADAGAGAGAGAGAAGQASQSPHFEQALFAEGLSAASVQALRPLLREHWAQLRQALVPVLEQMVATDAPVLAQDPQAAQRVRLGLFSFHQATTLEPGQEAQAAIARKGQAR